LGLDLIEELRAPVADRFVVGLMTRQMLGKDAFTTTMGGACYLSDQGRWALLEAYEEFKAETVVHGLLQREVPRGSLSVIQATLMARHLRGDLPAYPPFVMAR
jgi:CRISPR-associated protein Cas1